MEPTDPPIWLTWPRAANAPAAERLVEAFAALGPRQRRFAKTPQGRAVLACLGGNAPYLADLALKHSPCLLNVIANGPDPVIASIFATLEKTPLRLNRATLARRLRTAKAQAALTIALADLGNIWTLPQITGALSTLAEVSLSAATRHLLRALHDEKLIRLPHPSAPEQNSGFAALALGKLGAGELNYSSDIDLVLLYDQQSPAYSEAAQPTLARLARDLVQLLSHRDAHGYVFRVDLRLRPDPAATPPVVSLATALNYYESQGRTWERAAFSKARPIAGDLALGETFLAAIRPFIWRRHLDFAAIGEIHAMKRRIDSQAAATAGLLGFDVKLGRGGIREIEFIVQTLGLVWGGQEPGLRIPQTLRALPALARAGHLPEAAARELAADYQQLRRVEHRLQMIADRQTHDLPSTESGLADFILLLGQPDFASAFPALLARVHEHFLAFFNAGAAPDQTIGIDPGAAGAPPPAFAAQLQDLGFTNQKHITERLRAWLSGNVAALRSERARALLSGLLPKLLATLAAQPEPDKVFARFDTLISRQSASVQLLALLQRSKTLLPRLAAILGAAPALAEHLAGEPQALEALLQPSARFAAPKPVLRRILRDARDLEDAVTRTRRFVHSEDFHLSAATLEFRLDADEAGRLRSNLAAAALSALLPRVIADQEARAGGLPHAAFAVVALGKAGGGEMLAGSDLDLMLIYDGPSGAEAPVQKFNRLAQSFTGVLTAQGPGGPLYKVDMRLRPSGNQGPVAVSLAAFRAYHATQSWVWERLALTRARVLAATPGFAPVVSAEILSALSRPAAAAAIRAGTASMRNRLSADLPATGPFDVKHRAGGMLELGFIAEALQLIHGPGEPSLFRANTASALRHLRDAGKLPARDAAALIAADHLWRTIQGINRITGLPDSAATPPPAMLAPLLRATNTAELAALLATMANTGQTVRDCFQRHIEDAPP
jgi:glutamate-ammonia-ligase adenylyltransferase